MKRVFIYKRFERFWHWTQALFVFVLALTGFDLRFRWLEIWGFEGAVRIHASVAVAFLILVGLAVFWHLTTGEWKQYLPTKKFLWSMVRFYLIGIFHKAPHPVKKTLLSKLNPLQRLAYLGLKLLLIPLLVTSGLAYATHFQWSKWGLSWLDLQTVAGIHVFCAYALVAFVFTHLYLTTTGRTPLSNIKAMITGWEEMEEEETAGSVS